MIKATYVRLLHRAAEILGGSGALAARLRVRPADLARWMRGEGHPPDAVFLRAVDVVAENDDLIRSSARRVLASEEQLRRTAQTLAALRGELQPRLQAALRACLSLTAARKANIQVVKGGVLVLKAQLGFGRPFVDHFAQVRHEDGTACASALTEGRRVIVTDVASSPIFAGTRERDVVLAEGVAAVQSTPLAGTRKQVLGMLSSHYDRPGEPAPEELKAIDVIAARAAAWLDEQRAD